MKEKKINPKFHYGMGWIPDHPDQRDIPYAVPQAVSKKLPKSTDLRKHCPPVYNQECLSSCTGQSLAAAIEFEQARQNKKKAFTPSRLFIYYNERVMEGTVSSDPGAQLRDGIKSIANQGVCSEKKWPHTLGTCNVTGYDISQQPIYDTGSKFKKKPPKACYDEAIRFKVLSYESVAKTIPHLKGCLAEGFPFVFGFSVYVSFYDIGKNGIMSMPVPGESVVGGHAVLAVGYNEKKRSFIIRNSWGAQWGEKGYFYMPYSFITSANCSDFWTIRIVEM